jgi:probable O-glycosylation ligase (exosortase A-associated)
MRLSIVLAIVALISIAALIKPRIGLYGYIWFGLVRPDYLAFRPGAYNMATVLAVVTLVAGFRNFIHFKNLLKPIPVLLILMQIAVALSATFAAVPSASWETFDRFFRMSVMCLAVPVLITEEKHFRELFLVTAGSLGFMGFYWGLTAGMRGMRIWSGPAGMMGDNNSFAIGLAMILPFCWHAWSVVRQWWAKAAFAMMLMGSVVTIILTFSRGGALAAGLALLLLFLRSKNRMWGVVLIIVAILPIMSMVGVAYQKRLSTIETYKNDASAMSRLVQLRIAYAIWLSHPWLGVGIGDLNYLLVSRPYLAQSDSNVIVHNSYMQVLAHTGIIGFIPYMGMMMWGLGSTWKRGWRRFRTDPTAVYPLAIFISLIAYVIASITHPRAWFDLFYLLLLYASAWSGIAQRRERAAVAPAPSTRVVRTRFTRPAAIPL